jgi:hypothetical protein
MKYEGKVAISLEDEHGVKISCPFDVELIEDLDLGEADLLFMQAVKQVHGILVAMVATRQETLQAFTKDHCSQLNEAGGCMINGDCDRDAKAREGLGCKIPYKKKGKGKP